jgi:hypothetical protein
MVSPVGGETLKPPPQGVVGRCPLFKLILEVKGCRATWLEVNRFLKYVVECLTPGNYSRDKGAIFERHRNLSVLFNRLSAPVGQDYACLSIVSILLPVKAWVTGIGHSRVKRMSGHACFNTCNYQEWSQNGGEMSHYWNLLIRILLSPFLCKCWICLLGLNASPNGLVWCDQQK